MLAIEADAMGASGDGDPNAASVLLGVFRLSPLLLLLLFREADGVSACCCFFSGEIDLARSVGQPQGQIPHLGHMQLIFSLNTLLTYSACKSFLSAFLNLLFQFPISFVVLPFSLL